MADKIIDQLKSILNEDTYNAFKSQINDIINKKVEERVAVIEEQKLNSIRAVKNKLQNKAEQYAMEKIRQMEIQFTSVLEESKKQLEKTTFEKIKEIENKLVSKLDTVLEESVYKNIPKDILEEAVKSKEYTKVTDAVKNIIEEHGLSLDERGYKKIQILEKQISDLKNKLMEEQNARINIENRANTLRKELLLETKTSGLDDDIKRKIIKQFRNASYEIIEEQIDKSIEIIEESMRRVRRGQVVNNNNLIGDSSPNMQLTGGEKIIEEELFSRKEKQKSSNDMDDMNDVNLFTYIDDLMP